MPKFYWEMGDSGIVYEMKCSYGITSPPHTQIADHECPFSYVPNLDEEQKGSLKIKNAKSNGKQAKENYVHVRGIATNSHRLAEKVRREKIGEGMKFLQELITGKSMVLDEIINYVQSLQQQVEFLSMKLANGRPESDEKILLTNNSNISRSRILRTKGDSVDSLLAIDPRITTSHTTSHAMFERHETIPSMSRRTCQQLSSLSKMKQ